MVLDEPRDLSERLLQRNVQDFRPEIQRWSNQNGARGSTFATEGNLDLDWLEGIVRSGLS